MIATETKINVQRLKIQNFPTRGKSIYKSPEEEPFLGCSKDINQVYMVRQKDEVEVSWEMKSGRQMRTSGL